MPSPADLHTALLARLRTVPHLTVFDGYVPDAPPADATGRVYPYAVIWPGPGGDPTDADLITGGALTWFTRVTVAAGDLNWCMQAITPVRAALRDRRLHPQASPLRDETPASRVAMRVTDVTPVRWFFPLQFRCQI